MKFNVSMEDQLFNKLDKFSKRNYINRSAVISLAVNQFIELQKRIPEYINDIYEVNKKVM